MVTLGRVLGCDVNTLIGSHDILLVTLDTLRFDVAERCWREGRTPNLAARLPAAGWDKRHTPASFTYAAHHAFFAGFLPTPARPGKHPRLFAAAFPGSETSGPHTCVLDAADIPGGLRARGYHTACIGGVGFFNHHTPLGAVLPALFDEHHWDPSLGVTSVDSTARQVDLALAILQRCERSLFLFINVSALHQPNCIFSPGATRDSHDTMADALAYVDGELGRLLARLPRPTLAILTSDHGTSYGDDGYLGHRHAHPSVWEVPYAELLLEAA